MHLTKGTRMKLVLKGLIALALTKLSLVKGNCIDKLITAGNLCQVPEIDAPFMVVISSHKIL